MFSFSSQPDHLRHRPRINVNCLCVYDDESLSSHLCVCVSVSTSLSLSAYFSPHFPSVVKWQSTALHNDSVSFSLSLSFDVYIDTGRSCTLLFPCLNIYIYINIYDKDVYIQNIFTKIPTTTKSSSCGSTHTRSWHYRRVYDRYKNTMILSYDFLVFFNFND